MNYIKLYLDIAFDYDVTFCELKSVYFSDVLDMQDKMRIHQ